MPLERIKDATGSYVCSATRKHCPENCELRGLMELLDRETSKVTGLNHDQVVRVAISRAKSPNSEIYQKLSEGIDPFLIERFCVSKREVRRNMKRGFLRHKYKQSMPLC